MILFLYLLMDSSLGRFTLSGKVNGAVGGDSCNVKDEGPSNVKIELLSHTDDLVSSTSTTAAGSYLLTNIIPGPAVSLFYQFR